MSISSFYAIDYLDIDSKNRFVLMREAHLCPPKEGGGDRGAMPPL